LLVFKTKVFARRERISAASLCDAVRRAERGLVEPTSEVACDEEEEA
jgi:hypothetical protein